MIRSIAFALLAFLSLSAASAARADEPRSEEHEKYAAKLWSTIHHAAKPYTKWQPASEGVKFDFPAPKSKSARSYLNSVAAGDAKLPHRSVVVTEQLAADGKTVVGVTVFVKAAAGFDTRSQDWYWVHYTPDGELVLASADNAAHLVDGFIPLMEDGRLWVFAADSPELTEFVKHGELAKHVVRPGAGPGGITLKGPNAETLDAFTAATKK